MKLLRLIAALVITLCSFSAKADLFDFSYTFNDGAVVTGSLTGNTNGQFVDNVSNVSVELMGIALTGSPNMFATTIGLDHVSTEMRVSFDGNLNNFLFRDPACPSNNLGCTTSYFTIFYQTELELSEASVFLNGTRLHDDGFSVNTTGPYDGSRWTLTPVPEPETYAMLLAGLGLLGFAARRRKVKAD